MNEIKEGLSDSMCRNCQNWIFNDWYMCHLAPSEKTDENGFLILPIVECANHEKALLTWTKVLAFIDKALGFAAAALITISIIFFTWNSTADAIYYLLGAVLINQRGRLVDWIRRWGL